MGKRNLIRSIRNGSFVFAFVAVLIYAVTQEKHIKIQEKHIKSQAIYIKKLEASISSRGVSSGIPILNKEKLIAACDAEPNCMMDMVIDAGIGRYLTLDDMEEIVAESKRIENLKN